MNKIQRKLIPAFIVLAVAALCLSCFSVADHSAADDTNADPVEAEIFYMVSTDGTYATATSCSNASTATTATILSEYNGVPVTIINGGVFKNCIALTSVTIPDSVTTIGQQAFSKCPLTSVTIPDSVTTIGFAAFGYTDLHTINLPSALSSINARAFYCCTLLTSITVESGNANYSSISGCLCSFDGKTLVICPPGLTSVTIPDSVTTIGESAFSEGLVSSVTIPDSVTTIGESAFCECYYLTSVTIPDSVTTIGESAFKDCHSLTSVTIPDSVTTIGEYAFYECYGLTLVVIESGVTIIPRYCFDSCHSLTSVTIPDSVTTIGESAFCECYSLTSVTIPDSVTTIGEYVFVDCRSMQVLTWLCPSSSVVIGDYAFDFYDTAISCICRSISITDPATYFGDYDGDYVEWTSVIVHTVTVNYWEGNTATLYVDDGSAADLVTTREGYRFDGFTDADGNAWAVDAKVTSDLVLTAHWTAIVAVNFDVDGTGTSIAEYMGEKFILPEEPTKKGFTFAGWFTEKDGKGTQITADTIVDGSVTALYAAWTVKEYDVNTYVPLAMLIIGAAVLVVGIVIRHPAIICIGAIVACVAVAFWFGQLTEWFKCL